MGQLSDPGPGWEAGASWAKCRLPSGRPPRSCFLLWGCAAAGFLPQGVCSRGPLLGMVPKGTRSRPARETPLHVFVCTSAFLLSPSVEQPLGPSA